MRPSFPARVVAPWLLCFALVGLSAMGCGEESGSPGEGGGADGATDGGGADGSGATVGSGASGPSDGSGGSGTDGGGSGGASSGSGSATSSGGSGGGSGSGGGLGTGGAPVEPTGKIEVDCTVTVTSSEISPVIGTVGIIEFSSDLPGQNAAAIEFGLTTDYGLVAPVEFAGDNRTLLLGMTTDSEYHYRVLVVSDDTYCYGPDETMVTDSLLTEGPNHLPTEAGSSSASKAPGFVLTSDFNGGWAYIFNQDGKIVWAYEAPFANLSRALMSYDGKHMYVRELNLGRDPLEGRILKIGMDGSSPVVTLLPTSHHDFTVAPTGDIIYVKKTPSSECDSIYRHPASATDDSQDTLIFNVEDAFPSGGGSGGLENQTCHTNAIHYIAADGGFTASCLDHNAFFKISAAGDVEWVLGSADSTFTGEGAEWVRQHGHQLLPGSGPSEAVLLFFENGDSPDWVSVAREVTLDLDLGTATNRPFSYTSEHSSPNMGDVQRLPNGNTFVTYSTAAKLQEVGPDGEVVQTLEVRTSTGYATHRPTLYGAPPPHGVTP